MDRAAWLVLAVLAAAVLDGLLIRAWHRARKKRVLPVESSSSLGPSTAERVPARELAWQATSGTALVLGGLLILAAQTLGPRPPELEGPPLSIAQPLGLALFAGGAGLISWRASRKAGLRSPTGDQPRGPDRRSPAAQIVDAPRGDPGPVAVVALLAAGLFLFAGQMLRPAIPATLRWASYAANILGLLLFLLAVRGFSAGSFPSFVDRPLRRVAGWLHVSPAQAILLGLAPFLSAGAWLAAGMTPRMLLPAVAMPLWISSVACVLIGTWRAGSLPKVKYWPRGESLAVVGLFLTGFLARGTLTGEIPWVLSGDEASGGLYALDFVHGQRDNLFGLGFLSFPSLYFFVQSLSIRLFGQTTEALRLPSALVGALTVLTTYWFLREAFGRGVALAGATYLAAFHFHIHFSRLGLNNIWDGLFLTLTAAAFWRGWKGGGRMNFTLAGLSLGLAQYFYVGSRVLLLLFPFWLAVAFLRDRRRARARLSELAIVALAALVVALPLMLFYRGNPGDFSAPYSRVSLIGPLLERMVLASGEPVWRVLANQFKTSALAFTGTNLRYWYQPGYPMLLPIPATFFLMGICLILLRLVYLPELAIGLWIAGAVIVGAMSDSTPAAQRYVFAAPAVAAVIALPLERSAHWFNQARPGARRAILAAMGGVLLLAAWEDLRFYFGDFSANQRFSDLNTEVATRAGEYLADMEPGPEVYFFGGRMGYYTHSTIRYLAPMASGTDVLEPLSAPPDWVLPDHTVFIFLPERSQELEWVQLSYPGGTARWFTGKDGPLFLAYEIPGA